MKTLEKVIVGSNTYKNEYIRLEDSFYQIISSIISEGFDWSDSRVVEFF